jgi:hypothetical protein
MQKAADSSSNTTRRGRKPLSIFLGVVILAALATGAWYVLENITGRKAWESYVSQANAQVDSANGGAVSPERKFLWFKGIIPAEIPDEKNFATHPYLKWNFERFFTNKATLSEAEQRDEQRWDSFIAGSPSSTHRNKWAPSLASLRRANLAGIFGPTLTEKLMKFRGGGISQTNEAVPTFEEVLKLCDEKFEPNLALYEELRQYLKERPQARFPIRYQDNFDMPLPHLATIKGMSTYAAAFACMNLARGQSQEALQEILYMLDLGDTLAPEPLIVTQLVRVYICTTGMDILWEGLEAEAWNAEQLQQLQERISKVSFWDGVKLGLMGERACMNEALAQNPRRMDFMKEKLNLPQIYEISEYEVKFKKVKANLRPIGWYYRDLLQFNILMDSMLSILDDGARSNRPEVITEAFKEFDSYMDPDSRMKFTRLIALYEDQLHFKACFEKLAYHQFFIQAAEVACALERYRLANGSYPDSLKALGELMPEDKIPRSWVDGSPLQIRLTDKGYQLWVKAWNWESQSTAFVDSELDKIPTKGEWVWEIKR